MTEFAVLFDACVPATPYKVMGNESARSSPENSKKNYSESILNKDGKVIIVFTPELKHKNLYAIFPSEFENLTFIKYFFSKISNVDIDLVEDGWPYYRTYRVNR